MLPESINLPEWVPLLPEGKRILILGASGGIGRAVAQMIGKSKIKIGAHYSTSKEPLENINFEKADVHLFQKKFTIALHCEEVVDEFCEWAGGIDGVVVLAGGIGKSSHFMDLTPDEWDNDLFLNLSVPFYLARASLKKMRESGNGGRIILTGTESALHGGSSMSFPYAITKAGTECMVMGLAREGAKDSILVNGIRPGYITSGFHQRWHNKTEQDMIERAELVPLKRGGTPDEAAALIAYLISDWSNFITGQMFAITGGDWL